MRERLFVYLFLFLAVILRLDFLAASNFAFDSDEAIVGLMGKHILETGHIPVFYYGQHYMGSFEPMVTALSFEIFGINPFALKMVPLLFSIVFLFLVYRLGVALHSRAVGIVALLLGAVPPATLVIWSTKARGGFIEILCIGTAALLTCTYWCQRRSERSVYAAFTGLLLGFGWWVNNQVIYYMLPIGFVMLCVTAREKQPLRTSVHTFLTGCVAFFVGGAPFWLYNFEHNFASFNMFGSAGGSAILEHVSGFFLTAVPVLLGGKRYWHTQDVFPGATFFVWTLVACVLALCIYARRDSLRKLLVGIIDVQRPFELVFLLLMTTMVVFVLSSFGYLSQAPRYLLPAYSGLLLLFGTAIVLAWNSRKVLAVVLLASWFVLSGVSGYAGGRALPGEPFVFEQQRVQRDHAELIQWLENNNYSWVRTNYWVGYRLSFETNEAVRFLIFGEPHQTRIPAYEEQGSVTGRAAMPLVLVPAQASYVKQALDAQGYAYHEISLSGYTVLYDIAPAQSNLLPIRGLRGKVRDRPEYVPDAFDGDIATRWRSARPQSGDMFFSVILPEPGPVRALIYQMGAWPHDYPRELQIEVELQDGTRQKLYDAEDYVAVRYFLQGDTTLSFYMDFDNVVAIHLKQTGSHSLFDWSIAEIAAYR